VPLEHIEMATPKKDRYRGKPATLDQQTNLVRQQTL
jgi:hypothetical protein